ncbi:HK97 gp10 family phage protein [Devosia neptuniae]|uniref:HK97 gp10 family phage protein n=1 Tax=Devosia neptuniae TaxID=191302 RepID=A0ABY6CI87_9HYPH|nr:HK97-gp10 family putative phage morphogenesis protein [Devosia neptuniae]UXN70896.1 HK97 gp10 family phage protein [Devosia neptuniae]
MAKIFGLSSLEKKLRAIPKATRVEIRGVLEKSATEMVALAKSLAPTDDGDLVASIRQEPGKHDLSVVVRAGGEATTRNGYDYSLAVEHGTANMPDQQFFWPAYRAVKKRAKSRATSAVRKAARTAAGV